MSQIDLKVLLSLLCVSSISIPIGNLWYLALVLQKEPYMINDSVGS